jgi:hypothetical protein
LSTILEDDIVYIKHEGDYETLKTFFHGLQSYTEEQIETFKKNNILPFNAGHFLFKNTCQNKEHFYNIQIMIWGWTGTYFYEQSFMNHYFLLNNKFEGKLLEDFVELVRDKDITQYLSNPRASVLHFLNCSVPFQVKLQKMKRAYMKKQETNAQWFDSRAYISNAIPLNSESKIAEIGVFNGNFSDILLKSYNPKMLYLIDPYEGVVSSGDADGNNIITYEMKQLYHQMVNKYKNNDNITLLRAKSTILEAFADSFFDMIYIDGDHSFDGVKYDLEVAYVKTKDKGWICGHDLRTNAHKTQNIYNFDVEKAVWEFCLDKGLYISYLFMDGCVSYAIQVHKD